MSMELPLIKDRGFQTENIKDRPSGLCAVIPAYNEANRIGSVLSILSQVGEFDKIIVVDDGSKDGTSQEVILAAENDSRIQVISHPTNYGKGKALLTGLHIAEAQFILMLDADLVGLTPDHVRDLIQPVIEDEADMTIGLFKGGKFRTDLSHHLTPWLSGQRCVKAELFEKISWKAADGYGLETALSVTAKNQGWRIRNVTLQGVWHPPSEDHRGFLNGVLTRARMYGQVVRAWIVAGGPRSLLRKPTISKRFLLLVFLLLVGFSLIYDRSKASSSLSLSTMQVFPIQSSKKILVVAPHPDDETLGSGGIIQAALAQGSEVRVIIVTNGDGQMLAPLALNKKVLPKPSDYIKGGETRQLESLKALQALGVPESDVYFLSYPDHYMETIWQSDWTTEVPVQVRDTQVTRSPYPRTYDKNASYVGKDVISDIQAILADYMPDTIIVPHPNDNHPDHRAACEFTRMAVTLMESQNSNYRPAIWGYLVHYGYFPQPRGVLLSRPLLPPDPLAKDGITWYHFDLTDQQERTKLAAIEDYTTQMRLLGTFLTSFARPDEIFASIPELELSTFDSKPVAVSESGINQYPTLAEPKNQSARRLFMEGANLTGWHVLRIGQDIWLTAVTQGHMLPGLNYSILVKTPEGVTRKYLSGPLAWWAGNSFTIHLNLNDMGNPAMLGFSAEVSQKISLDHTAWNFVVLR